MKDALKNVELHFENGKIAYSELNNIRFKYLSCQLKKVKSKYNCCLDLQIKSAVLVKQLF